MRFCVYTIMFALCLAAGAENLIGNPSFEEQENGTPVGWLRYRLEPEQFYYGEAEAHSGKHSVGILDKQDKTSAGWLSESFLRVEAGAQYHLSGWIKTENAWGGNALNVSLYTLQNGRPLWRETRHTPEVNGTKPWTHVELTFTVPEKIEFVKIGAVRRHAAPGKAFFDNLSFVKLGAAAETSPRAEPLRIDWSRAVAAEPLRLGKLLRTENVPAKAWEMLERTGGELAVKGETLTIADTALPGVGWLSPPFAAEPGRVYEFEATVNVRKAWHVRLAALALDGQGKVLEIRQGEALAGERDQVRRLLAVRPASGAKTLRFALIQSRSSGVAEFEKLTVRCFEETNE